MLFLDIFDSAEIKYFVYQTLEQVDEYTLILLIAAIALSIYYVQKLPDMTVSGWWYSKKAIPTALACVGLSVIVQMAAAHGTAFILAGFFGVAAVVATVLEVGGRWMGGTLTAKREGKATKGEDGGKNGV